MPARKRLRSLSAEQMATVQSQAVRSGVANMLMNAPGKTATCTARRFCAAAIAFLSCIVLSACGTLPLQPERAYSPAQPVSADSPLVRIAQASTPAPDLTGFRLMPLGFY